MRRLPPRCAQPISYKLDHPQYPAIAHPFELAFNDSPDGGREPCVVRVLQRQSALSPGAFDFPPNQPRMTNFRDIPGTFPGTWVFNCRATVVSQDGAPSLNKEYRRSIEFQDGEGTKAFITIWGRPARLGLENGTAYVILGAEATCTRKIGSENRDVPRQMNAWSYSSVVPWVGSRRLHMVSFEAQVPSQERLAGWRRQSLKGGWGIGGGDRLGGMVGLVGAGDVP
eukprot:9475436-Pyramimonas_sp.AAC.1